MPNPETEESLQKKLLEMHVSIFNSISREEAMEAVRSCASSLDEKAIEGWRLCDGAWRLKPQFRKGKWIRVKDAEKLLVGSSDKFKEGNSECHS